MSVRPLPPDLQQRAIAELNEDPKRVQDDIRHIKEWLKKQPHLKARTGEIVNYIVNICRCYIVNFRRSVYFNLPSWMQV